MLDQREVTTPRARMVRDYVRRTSETSSEIWADESVLEGEDIAKNIIHSLTGRINMLPVEGLLNYILNQTSVCRHVSFNRSRKTSSRGSNTETVQP